MHLPKVTKRMGNISMDRKQRQKQNFEVPLTQAYKMRWKRETAKSGDLQGIWDLQNKYKFLASTFLRNLGIE
jgi:hypothetical protein